MYGIRFLHPEVSFGNTALTERDHNVPSTSTGWHTRGHFHSGSSYVKQDCITLYRIKTAHTHMCTSLNNVLLQIDLLGNHLC